MSRGSVSDRRPRCSIGTCGRGTTISAMSWGSQGMGVKDPGQGVDRAVRYPSSHRTYGLEPVPHRTAYRSPSRWVSLSSSNCPLCKLKSTPRSPSRIVGGPVRPVAEQRRRCHIPPLAPRPACTALDVATGLSELGGPGSVTAGDAQGVGDLGRVEAEHLARNGRRAQHAENAGLVKAPGQHVLHARLSDPTGHLGRDNHTRQ